MCDPDSPEPLYSPEILDLALRLAVQELEEYKRMSVESFALKKLRMEYAVNDPSGLAYWAQKGNQLLVDLITANTVGASPEEIQQARECLDATRARL